MDLSKVKWVFIAAIVIGGGWLVTEGGINWAYNRATATAPGEDEAKDKVSETTLSRYGGFLLTTFRYEKARKFYNEAITRFPGGANAYYNRYQLARCEDKLGNFQNETDLLYSLWEIEAHQYDARVPNNDELKLRIQKLVEVHELGDPFQPQR
jgi:hypothetical protein